MGAEFSCVKPRRESLKTRNKQLQRDVFCCKYCHAHGKVMTTPCKVIVKRITVTTLKELTNSTTNSDQVQEDEGKKLSSDTLPSVISTDSALYDDPDVYENKSKLLTTDKDDSRDTVDEAEGDWLTETILLKEDDAIIEAAVENHENDVQQEDVSAVEAAFDNAENSVLIENISSVTEMLIEDILSVTEIPVEDIAPITEMPIEDNPSTAVMPNESIAYNSELLAEDDPAITELPKELVLNEPTGETTVVKIKVSGNEIENGIVVEDIKITEINKLPTSMPRCKSVGERNASPPIKTNFRKSDITSYRGNVKRMVEKFEKIGNCETNTTNEDITNKASALKRDKDNVNFKVKLQRWVLEIMTQIADEEISLKKYQKACEVVQKLLSVLKESI